MPSQWKEETARCPQCHQESAFPTCTVVDIQDDPEGKKAFLEESFFLWRCPHCGLEVQAHYEMDIIDRKASYLLAVREKIATPEAFAVPSAYVSSDTMLHLRLVQTLAEVAEKIRIFDASLDDRAIECFKVLLLSELPDKPSSLDIRWEEKIDDTFLFSLSVPQYKPQLIKAPEQMYQFLCHTLEKSVLVEPLDKLSCINQSWAESYLATQMPQGDIHGN